MEADFKCEEWRLLIQLNMKSWSNCRCNSRLVLSTAIAFCHSGSVGGPFSLVLSDCSMGPEVTSNAVRTDIAT